MPDVMSKEARSRVMARNRCKGTTPEVYVEKLARAAGLDFETHAVDLAGKPDLVFRESKVAVFVEGDFWHGWRFPIWQHRLNEKWRTKIQQTRERDQRNHRKLRSRGWKVVRLWEHQVEENVLACITRIGDALGKDIDASIVDEAYRKLPPLKRRNRLPRP